MKKILCLLLSFALCFVLTGCNSVSYEDTNGEDNYTLQTITDENIINLDIGSSGLSYKENHLGDLLLSKEYSAKNFNGVEEIYLTNLIGKSDVRVYIGHLNVTGGNFKLAVINNNKIIHEFALDTFNQEFYFEDLTGSFSIHVAGESAAFDMNIEVE